MKTIVASVITLLVLISLPGWANATCTEEVEGYHTARTLLHIVRLSKQADGQPHLVRVVRRYTEMQVTAAAAFTKAGCPTEISKDGETVRIITQHAGVEVNDAERIEAARRLLSFFASRYADEDGRIDEEEGVALRRRDDAVGIQVLIDIARRQPLSPEMREKFREGMGADR